MVKKDKKQLKEVEDDSVHSVEQKELYRDRLEDLKTERQARFDIATKSKGSSNVSHKN